MITGLQYISFGAAPTMFLALNDAALSSIRLQRTSADFVKGLFEDEKTLCMVCVASLMKENILLVKETSST